MLFESEAPPSRIRHGGEYVRIETDRLVLRPVQAGDEAAIYTGINDYDVVKNLARAPWPYLTQHAEAFVARSATLDPKTDQPLAVLHREIGLIGVAGFMSDPKERFPEFGYWIAREHWNLGYGSEAAAAALAWAGASWGKRAVRAGHFVDNAASGRALIKAGMLHTGDVLPQHSLARGEPVMSRKMIWLA